MEIDHYFINTGFIKANSMWFAFNDGYHITTSLNKKVFVDDTTPIEYIDITNIKANIEYAKLYRKDEWRREKSIKLMEECRKIGQKHGSNKLRL